MKASEDCKARIEEQLNSISSLKKSLFDEIAALLENLNAKSKQWEGFQEQLDKFVEYMDNVDSRLERSRKESRVSQEWLAQVKVKIYMLLGYLPYVLFLNRFSMNKHVLRATIFMAMLVCAWKQRIDHRTIFGCIEIFRSRNVTYHWKL